MKLRKNYSQIFFIPLAVVGALLSVSLIPQNLEAKSASLDLTISCSQADEPACLQPYEEVGTEPESPITLAPEPQTSPFTLNIVHTPSIPAADKNPEDRVEATSTDAQQIDASVAAIVLGTAVIAVSWIVTAHGIDIRLKR